MRGVLAAVLCMSFAGLACAAEPVGAKEDSASITPVELAERIGDKDAPFVLDVRTTGEFAAGHIPGAVIVPHTELEAKRALLPKALDRELVVHCESGGRALAAERWLREQGYTRVRDLEEHMRGWRSAGHPTVQP